MFRVMILSLLAAVALGQANANVNTQGDGGDANVNWGAGGVNVNVNTGSQGVCTGSHSQCSLRPTKMSCKVLGRIWGCEWMAGGRRLAERLNKPGSASNGDGNSNREFLN